MLVYIVMFIICIVAAAMAERAFKKENKKLGILFSAIAILVPSIIAGIRSLELGYDIRVYGKVKFYLASIMPISSFIASEGFLDIFYTLLNVIIAKTFNNFHVFLFTLQFINCLLAYKACYNMKDKVPIWLSFFAYIIIIYFRQYNWLRQGIALSCSVYAFSFLVNHKERKYWIWTGISILFHISSVLSVLIYFLYKMFNKKEKIGRTHHKKMVMLIIYVLLIVGLLFTSEIVNFVASSGILPDKYNANYFMRFEKDVIKIDTVGFFFRLLLIAFTGIVILGKVNTKQIENLNFYYHMAVIDFILFNYNVHITNFERTAYYYGIISFMFLVPNLSKLFKNNRLNRIITNLLIVGILLTYWYLRYVYQNAGLITPYAIGI